MTNFVHELSRLFFLPDQEAALSQLVSASLVGDGYAPLPLLSEEQRVRALVVDITRTSDWSAVSALYQGVQEEFDFPAPATSISPETGFQVWFSLSEPIPVVQAVQFLEALRKKYLADIPERKVTLHPGRSNSSTEVVLVPSCHQASGRWSAFIDPTLGSMFADEPGLEMAPNLGRQADMLVGVKSIKETEFRRALALLQGERETEELTRQPACPADSREVIPPTDGNQAGAMLKVGSGFTDPKTFLLAVMNDPSASAKHRIQAAKALLPYYEKARHE